MFVSKIRRPLSHDAFQKAKNLIPGGVNSPARAFGGVGGEPFLSPRPRAHGFLTLMATDTSILSGLGVP